MYQFIFLLILFSSQTFAKDIQSEQFESQAQYHQYLTLTHQIRCVVCQNQTIADSNADIAKDLRSIIYKKTVSGESSSEIKDFLVSRYGDFILYQPSFNKKNLLLWLGPWLFLILAIWIARKSFKTKA